MTATLRPRAIPAATPRCPTAADWRVVGPWYRWERRDGLEPERAADAERPALHKYASASFVADFLADPQRSVVFDPAVDSHFPLQTVDPKQGGPKLRLLGAVQRLAPDSRKLFLAAHQRFYTVSVGLHCAEPGFPMVDPSRVAEAGFVLRRHRAVVPEPEAKTGFTLLQELTATRAKAQVRFGYETATNRSRILHPFRSPHRQRVVSPSTAAVDAARQVELARRRLRVWAASAGVEHVTEGWVPSGEGAFGAWVPLPDEPEELIERSYPLRVLAPPPDDPTHAAHDGTVLWGAIPTASDEVATDGTARFSAFDLYDLRAWVRADCGHCPGTLIWSAPTAPFHLASFYDPDGCAQNPTDVQLPDFADLQAASALPSVKMTAPPGSSVKIGSNGAPTVGQGFEICFFSIPLITIVAMFVLNIFLPIILLVFQLWWMLKLKFCIPPSIQFEADLAAELDITPPELELMADVDIDLLPGIDQTALAGVLANIFAPPIDPAHAGAKQDDPDANGTAWPLDQKFDDDLSNDPLVKLALAQGYGSPNGGTPDFAPPLTYTSRVAREDVIHP